MAKGAKDIYADIGGRILDVLSFLYAISRTIVIAGGSFIFRPEVGRF